MAEFITLRSLVTYYEVGLCRKFRFTDVEKELFSPDRVTRVSGYGILFCKGDANKRVCVPSGAGR